MTATGRRVPAPAMAGAQRNVRRGRNAPAWITVRPMSIAHVHSDASEKPFKRSEVLVYEHPQKRWVTGSTGA